MFQTKIPNGQVKNVCDIQSLSYLPLLFYRHCIFVELCTRQGTLQSFCNRGCVVLSDTEYVDDVLNNLRAESLVNNVNGVLSLGRNVPDGSVDPTALTQG